MSLRVAIVADDLTGALDTSAPFVAQGLKVVVAASLAGLAGAMAETPEVLVLNTASRQMRQAEAREVAGRAAEAIKALSPEFVFKKIDSRLKGNIVSETEAMAAAFAPSRIVVAPAVPDQGRFTSKGMAVGAGIERPLSIADAFAGLDRPFEIADVASQDDLDVLVSAMTPDVLLIGARGLGAALARRLAKGSARALHRFEPRQRTLLAFGSRDPITAAQIEFLARRDPAIPVVDAPQGRLSVAPPVDLPMVVRCTGPFAEPERVAADFAEAIVAALYRSRPDTLVMGGGDTAMAVLARLGGEIIVPLGEAQPGVPWFLLQVAPGVEVQCLVKSGGFGNVSVLGHLVPQMRSEARTA
ncbi:MAG: four-carbon acid sugar kinase family protein [Devosia sp.]|nr:four-carbon acid sugar kinase family protein [Devosia sp.]